MPVLIVLLSHVKKNNLDFGDWPLSKEIPVSVARVARGRFTTLAAAFQGCWECAHVPSAPRRRLQQEGSWHHLGKAFCSCVGFSFLIRAKDKLLLTWREQNTSRIPSLFIPSVWQIKTASGLFFFFSLVQLNVSAPWFFSSWRMFSLEMCRN